MNPLPARNPNLLDYWRILYGFKWMIAGLVLTSAVVTGIVAKLSPKIYEAKASLLPVREESMSGGGISFGGGKDKGGGGGGGNAGMILETLGGKAGGPSLLDTLNILLASRTMAEIVVQKLNLQDYYGTSFTRSVDALRGETSFYTTQFKSIDVKVETTDPHMAAKIANAYVESLDQLNKERNITASKRNRIFIDARLEEKSKKLAEVENALKTFQVENKTFGFSERFEHVSAAAKIHGQIVALEVELAALKEYATPSHPMINQLRAQIDELRRKLDEMEEDELKSIGKKQKGRAHLSEKFFASFEETPTLELEFIRLSRQVKVEEAVYGMLVGMLEQAKIHEARDLPTIQVMDLAIPPEVRSRPKTLQYIEVAAALAFVFGIFLAFLLDYIERLKAQEQGWASPQVGSEALLVGDQNGDSSQMGVYPAAERETERLHG